MAKSTNRYFQFLGSSKNARSGQLWYPAADVFQTPEGWMVKVELAGDSVQDIQIDVQRTILFTTGARNDRPCAFGGSYHQIEITYSTFEKTLKSPASNQGVKLEHIFDNGLLII